MSGVRSPRSAPATTLRSHYLLENFEAQLSHIKSCLSLPFDVRPALHASAVDMAKNRKPISAEFQQDALEAAQAMIRRQDGTVLHWTRGMQLPYGWGGGGGR